MKPRWRLKNLIIFWLAVLYGVMSIMFFLFYFYIGAPSPFMALIVGLSSLGLFLFIFLFPDEPEGSESSEYSRMIKQLVGMGNSLGKLSAFLERERARVTETERTLKELQKEKADLDPVVATKRQIVDAILSAHAKRGRVSVWKDRIIGFSIGVLSSLMAIFIWDIFTKR